MLNEFTAKLLIVAIFLGCIFSVIIMYFDPVTGSTLLILLAVLALFLKNKIKND